MNVVMKTGYNENSSIQASTIPYTLNKLQEIIPLLKTSSEPGSIFTISDYGVSHAANSIPIVSEIINLVRTHNPNNCSNIYVIHEDLPLNDWKCVFNILQNNPNSYTKMHKNVYAFATGKSFYNQCMRNNSVDIGFSCLALHWLSKIPCYLKRHVFNGLSSAEEQKIWAEHAKQDWMTILTNRSNELKVGGLFIIVSILKHAIPSGPYPQIEKVLQELVEEKLLTENDASKIAHPTYIRSKEEYLDEEILKQTNFECLNFTPIIQDTPLYIEYNKTKDLNEFSINYTKWFRGFMDNTMINGLKYFNNDKEVAEKLELIWNRVAEKIVQEPENFKGQFAHAFIALRKLA